MKTPNYLGAVSDEIYKGMRVAWSERMKTLNEFPTLILLGILLPLMLGQGCKILSISGGSLKLIPQGPYRITRDRLAGRDADRSIAGHQMFWRLLSEIQSGTLDQVYLSPLSAWFVTAVG